MSNSTMKLWDQVKSTDPTYSKQANNGRFSFTTIDPQYQLQEATRMWGPYGEHWGMKNLNWNVLSESSVMMLSCDFFYPSENQTDVEGVRHVSFPIAVDGRIKPGDDMCKKLMTSARSKALSFLGFSADVFLGKFDDAAYVADQEKRYGDQEAFMAEALGKIKLAKTANSLNKVEERVTGMVAKDTISPASGALLLEAIKARCDSLAE